MRTPIAFTRHALCLLVAVGGLLVPSVSHAQALPDAEFVTEMTPGSPGTKENPLVAELSLPVGSETTSLDWGRVGLDKTVYGRVQVVNTSAEPIRILAMRASCQCTTLDDLSGTTLDPGQAASALISVETRTIAGTIRNQIRFVFSDQTTTTVELVFEASRSVEAVPGFIDALANPYGVIKLRSLDGRPFKVLSTHGTTPIYAFAFDPEKDEPRSEYMLVWNLEGYDPINCLDATGSVMPLWWVIETDHPGAPLVDLRVRHDPCTKLDIPTPTRRWYLSKNHAVLGQMPAGASAEFEVKMKWLRQAVVNDVVSRVSEDDDRFDAEVVSVTREGDEITAIIRVTLSESARGLVYGRLVVHGEDPRNSQFMPIVARAVDPADVSADSRR